MSDVELQVLRDFRGRTPRPDAETVRRIYALATASGEHRRRRLAPRVAAVAAAAAAVALGLASFLPGEEVSAAARAATALNPSGDSILHVVVVTRTTGPDGAASSGRSELWQHNVAPFDRRSLEGSGDHRRELGWARGRPQYYDRRTDTIAVVPATVEVPAGLAGRGEDGGAQRLLRYMRNLLASGRAREDGRLRVDGREAIRLVSVDARLMLVVDARTYDPIEWTIVSDEGIRETSRFETYELLPATVANLALVSLSAQHPDAALDPSLKIEGVGPVGAKSASRWEAWRNGPRTIQRGRRLSAYFAKPS